MFKELRNKFIILNMSIITIVMFVSFVTIYLVTYNSIQSESKKKLEPTPTIANALTNMAIEEQDDLETKVLVKGFSVSDSPIFNIEVDENGNIISVTSFFEMPESSYEKAKELAWNEKQDYSTIESEGRKWMYVVRQPVNNQVVYKNGIRTTVSIKNGTYQIVFLDITDSLKGLFSLFITLLIVGLVMLFIIMGISIYFANRAVKPIKEAWNKQKQFIADASHEIKTPLAVINANADALISNEEKTVKSQKKWLNNIKSEINRMGKLASDLLYLAKTEDMEENIIMNVFDISNIVNEVILSMEAVAFEKEIKLHYKIEPNLSFKGDIEKIKRAVIILLDNAIKYTDKQGDIDINLKKVKNQIIFTIKNTGEGIKKDELTKIFDRFYRADKSRNSESGSYGLGLPIAKSIIEKSGGKIYAISTENESTTLIFTLKV